METVYNLNCEYIFMHQISMLKDVFFIFIYMLKRIKPDIKLFIAGDLNQLAPIDYRIQKYIKKSLTKKTLYH